MSTQRSCHTDPATQETVRQDSRTRNCGVTATRQRVYRIAYPAVQGGMRLSASPVEWRTLLGGSSRAVTTAVPQISTTFLPMWCKLTLWRALRFVAWPQSQVQVYAAKCDSGSRPLSSVLTNEHHHIRDPEQSLCRTPGSPTS